MMSVKILLVLGFVQLCVGGKLEKYFNEVTVLSPAQAEERGSSLAQKFKDLIRKLRPNMTTGFPEYNIPPLDPLKIGSFSLQPWDLGLGTHLNVLNFTDVTVYGLRNFDLTKVDFSLLKQEITLNLTLFLVKLNGSYVLKGKVLHVFDVGGSGPFRVELSTVKLGLNAKVGIGSGKLQLKTLTFSFNVGHIKLHFENLLGGGDVAKMVNDALQVGANTFLNKFEGVITEKMAEFALPALNKVLARLDFDKIIPD